MIDMVQPILGAIDAWLAIWYNLPYSIKALCSLAVGCFLLTRLVVIVWHE